MITEDNQVSTHCLSFMLSRRYIKRINECYNNSVTLLGMNFADFKYILCNSSKLMYSLLIAQTSFKKGFANYINFIN